MKKKSDPKTRKAPKAIEKAPPAHHTRAEYLVLDMEEPFDFSLAINKAAEKGYRVISAWEREAEFDGMKGRRMRAFTAVMERPFGLTPEE